MSNLIKKRGTLKAKLTSFGRFINELQGKPEIDEVDMLQVKERLAKIEPTIDEFDEVQTLIEGDSEDMENEIKERESFEKEYFLKTVIGKRIVRDNEPQSGGTTKQSPCPLESSFNSNDNSQNQSIRLPTIHLPKFDGNYLKWLEFRDTYESLIHKNDSISDIQKYHYLRASLEGGASQILQSLEFTAINYPVAWDALLNRYDNKRLLVHNHVRSIFNIEAVTKESASGLRKILETMSKNLRALKQLEQPTENWDTLIIYIACSKLDNSTLREWESYKIGNQIPSLTEFNTFLKSRADLLETIQLSHDKGNRELKNTKGFLTIQNKISYKCRFCKGEHFIQNCPAFTKLNVNDRVESIKKLKLCLNCLRPGHDSKVCRSGTCKKCNLKHHTLIHFEKANTNDSSVEQRPKMENSILLSAHNTDMHVLLATACVQILDRHNNIHTIRALLDSGSQSSFITEELCQKLSLKTHQKSVNVVGLNSSCSRITSECQVNVQSLHNNFNANILCLVVPEISGNIPGVSLNISKLTIPKNIKLADPSFFKSSKIDMLIGADLFWNLICIGQISLGTNKLILQKTRLGWIVSGSVGKVNSEVMCNFRKINIEDCLSKFWEVEEAGMPTKQFSLEELECEAHFTENTRRDENGRFIVNLPLKYSTDKLGDSYEHAKNRFLSIERKLQSKPHIKEQYINFMNEYISLGHMKKADGTDSSRISYYMPHHFVLKEESLTTKLRVVFDASAPSSSGFSLNHLQMTGPTIQSNLFSILLRFRQHRFVVAGDIAKMYRQIKVTTEQTCLQRILWREHPDQTLSTFELNTVTYGTTAAPFLAIRCLFQLAQENKIKHPRLAEVIESDFYVDDMLTGSNSIEKTALLAKGVQEILKTGCFELRKFYSNHSDVLKYVKTEDDSDIKVIEFGLNENAKTLGLTWCPAQDKLMYSISEKFAHTRVSKRTILSSISQVFDPLGLLSPVIINIKILLQKLWLEKLSWDEGVPSYINQFWCNFREDLPVLNNLRIDRFVVAKNPKRVELHAFSDASEKAYGGAIYLRTINENNKIYTHLLCAKSKVAPLKTVTLPKLELMGASVLAKLAETVTKSLKIRIDEQTFWTDSTIVLGWLKTEPNKLKTFVSNRIAKIQESTCFHKWKHVSSKDNPADLLSRGVMPKQMQNLSLWWHGPLWLSKDVSFWPKNICNTDEEVALPEFRKPTQCAFISKVELNFHIENFSNLLRLKRVTAWILRFIHNSRPNCEMKTYGDLSLNEINNAFKLLIKVAQNNSFSNEIHDLKANKELHFKSRTLSLNPFIDRDGTLRVGGRLKNSNFSPDKKHPILLCSKHPLTKLIFLSEHVRLLHCGPQQLLANIRETFWPISGRNLAKSIVKQCIPCFKVKPKIIQPIMGQLPESRLQSGPPFNITGVDYAGPFFIKDRKGRGAKVSKCYMGLFICFATKAIHLELISDLTKDTFLMALKRFVSRRGIPSKMFSDNGSNFVAAQSELRQLGEFLINQKGEISQSCTVNNIDWQFIPPYSPHFGGLWEAGVKSSKRHLKTILGNAHLTFEEFNTLLVQVEAILNSRPLFPLSSNSSDLVPLTPAHFLVGRPLTALPDPDLREIPNNRLSRFQHLQQCQQHFWTRWHKEYLAELQQRHKWKGSNGVLQDNAMVLIKDDNTPPLRWKLGRIVKLHPGHDGISRVATVKTANGEIKRSFSRLCPLPNPENV